MLSFDIMAEKDENLICQTCGAELPESPQQKKSVKCPECGYINYLLKKKIKNLSEQIAELTADASELGGVRGAHAHHVGQPEHQRNHKDFQRKSHGIRFPAEEKKRPDP